MNARMKSHCLLSVLMAALSLIPVGRATAQTFKVLHHFDDTTGAAPDGGAPGGGLVLSGNTLYGTAAYGGTSDDGSVFKVNTDGTGFATLYTFTGGSDGSGPGGLILSGNPLYGTAGGGPTSYDGSVFKVNTDGTGFATLYSFTGGSDGGDPVAGVILWFFWNYLGDFHWLV